MTRNFCSHPRFHPEIWLALWLLLAMACGVSSPAPPPGVDSLPELDRIAESYVRLVLALGEHDAGYVDAYYGPEEWPSEVEEAGRSLAQITRETRQQLADLAALQLDEAEELVQQRRRYLARQLESLIFRADMVGGAQHDFDTESQALYDGLAPVYGAEHFAAVLTEVEVVLAEEGLDTGPLIDRIEAFRSRFVIPTERLDAVFRAAIDACRQRTAAQLPLPEGESFKIEYVNDKPWSGYNWYQGKFSSLIQVNTDLPIYIDRAIDLACHEGYPGHHLYNAMLEQHLVRQRGWVELSIYPLFSPQSLIAEGSANYGIELAFPGQERVEFEARELFPLAGLDADKAAAYYRVHEMLAGLKHADNQAARGYLDGTMDREQAIRWLMDYSAMSRPRAEQRLSFVDTYRSYVINYNVGLEVVRAYVEQRSGGDPAARWQVFGELLSSPRLPSDLQLTDAPAADPGPR